MRDVRAGSRTTRAIQRTKRRRDGAPIKCEAIPLLIDFPFPTGPSTFFLTNTVLRAQHLTAFSGPTHRTSVALG